MRTWKISLLLISLLLIFTTSVSAKDSVTINTDNLNVRSGPGTNHEKIGQVNTGETYPIVDQTNDWIKIQFTNGTGWITSKFATVNRDEHSAEVKMPDSANTKTKNSITIPYDNTQIRNGPGTKYEIIRFAKKGTTFHVRSETDKWYEISNDEITGYLFKKLVSKNNKSSDGIKNKTIVLDAGHGGFDAGAIGASGTFEKKITYKTAMELKQELEILGADVVLTRDEDRYVSLSSRTSLANIAGTDAFISIHYNSVPALPDVTGIGTYYYDDQNKDLAKTVQREIIKETDVNDRGIDYGDFQVLRQNFTPAILVELGFISNHEKEQLLLTDAYQKQLVNGIVTGLTKYFAEQ